MWGIFREIYSQVFEENPGFIEKMRSDGIWNTCKGIGISYKEELFPHGNEGNGQNVKTMTEVESNS